MYKLTTSYTVPLSLALAQRFNLEVVKGKDRSLERYVGERPMYDDILEYLEKQKVEGRFYSLHWIIAEHDGKLYRVNGKHTASLICKWERETPGTIKRLATWVHIDEFFCVTEDDLALLCESFDNAESVRKLNDYIRIIKNLPRNVTLSDVPDEAIAHIIRGVRKWLNVKKRTRELPSLINEDPAFVKEAERYASCRSRLGPTYTSRIGSVLYGTWQLAQADIAKWHVFWSEVFGLASSAPDSPMNMLSKHLAKKEDRNDESIIARASNAWNAYVQGRTLTVLNTKIGTDATGKPKLRSVDGKFPKRKT